jgi:RimJ/RimL family protein N-acetyltransferase
MNVHTNEILLQQVQLQPLTEEDIPLFSNWLDKDYIGKWFGEKEHWLNEIHQRDGKYHFLNHFIVSYNGKKIGYCLYTDCFFLKNLQEDAYDVSFWNELYGDIPEANHTYEIGYLIGEEEYLNKGIGKIIIQKLEEQIVAAGGKRISADPSEENIVSVKVLLSNGFNKIQDGYYRKTLR